MDLDFLAAVTTSKSPADPFSDDGGAVQQFLPNKDADSSQPPQRQHQTLSPGHPKLSPAAGAFIRSLPDLSFMLVPPGMSEARE